jgi:uncharacterized membrane protein
VNATTNSPSELNSVLTPAASAPLRPAWLALAAIATLVLSWVVLSSMGRSLWFDEAFSVWAARDDVAGVIASARADTWPPLYHLGLHGWMLTFGASEGGVRSFSLIAYLLGALVLYWLGLEVGRSRTAATAAVLAFATNSVLLKQAVTARVYPLLVLFAASSVLFFVKGLCL